MKCDHRGRRLGALLVFMETWIGHIWTHGYMMHRPMDALRAYYMYRLLYLCLSSICQAYPPEWGIFRSLTCLSSSFGLRARLCGGACSGVQLVAWTRLVWSCHASCLQPGRHNCWKVATTRDSAKPGDSRLSRLHDPWPTCHDVSETTIQVSPFMTHDLEVHESLITDPGLAMDQKWVFLIDLFSVHRSVALGTGSELCSAQLCILNYVRRNL